MKIKVHLMKTSENPGKIRKTHWKANARKKHEWTIKTIKGKPKKSLKNRWKPTKTNMNTKKQQEKPMKTNEQNNDKQRTTHENHWEPKENIWTHQGKTNENHRKTKEGTMKNHGKPKTILPAF